MKAFFTFSERQVKNKNFIEKTIKSLSTITTVTIMGSSTLLDSIKLLNRHYQNEVNPMKWYIIVVEIQTTEDNYHVQSSEYLGYYEYNKIINPYKRNNLVLNPINFLFI